MAGDEVGAASAGGTEGGEGVSVAEAVAFGVGGVDDASASPSPPTSPSASPVPAPSPSSSSDAVVSFANPEAASTIRSGSVSIVPSSLSASFAVPASTATDVFAVAFPRAGPESMLKSGLSASFVVPACPAIAVTGSAPSSNGDASSCSMFPREISRPGGLRVVRSMVRVGSMMPPHCDSTTVSLCAESSPSRIPASCISSSTSSSTSFK
mmetsp:Transcript_7387/g.16124  ORF Transcript_7387/g.16124 Transcript_7387/m.16124 type:complete len:210 (-) Transcript_7387:602-1231(-)